MQSEWIIAWPAHLGFPVLSSVPHLLSREIVMNRCHSDLFVLNQVCMFSGIWGPDSLFFSKNWCFCPVDIEETNDKMMKMKQRTIHRLFFHAVFVDLSVVAMTLFGSISASTMSSITGETFWQSMDKWPAGRWSEIPALSGSRRRSELLWSPQTDLHKNWHIAHVTRTPTRFLSCYDNRAVLSDAQIYVLNFFDRERIPYFIIWQTGAHRWLAHLQSFSFFFSIYNINLVKDVCIALHWLHLARLMKKRMRCCAERTTTQSRWYRKEITKCHVGFLLFRLCFEPVDGDRQWWGARACVWVHRSQSRVLEIATQASHSVDIELGGFQTGFCWILVL